MRLESNHPGGDQQRRAVLDPPLRPALRPSRSAAQDPPYAETTFNPTTTATITPLLACRAGAALSANATRPTAPTPIPPLPLHNAEPAPNGLDFIARDHHPPPTHIPTRVPPRAPAPAPTSVFL